MNEQQYRDQTHSHSASGLPKTYVTSLDSPATVFDPEGQSSFLPQITWAMNCLYVTPRERGQVFAPMPGADVDIDGSFTEGLSQGAFTSILDISIGPIPLNPLIPALCCWAEFGGTIVELSHFFSRARAWSSTGCRWKRSDAAFLPLMLLAQSEKSPGVWGRSTQKSGLSSAQNSP